MAILNFPPTAGEPIDGSFTYTSDGVTYSWDGYKWTADTGSGSGGGDANHSDGPTPPTTGELADQWYNTDDGRLYTYTADSSGALVWIDASPDSIAGGSGGSGGDGTSINYNGASAWGVVRGVDGEKSSGLNFTSTKTSTGKYQVTFDTPMSSGNYSVVQSTLSTGGKASFSDPTPTGFTISTLDLGTEQRGDYDNTFAVHSENAIAPQSGVGADAWVRVDGDASIFSSYNVANDGVVKTGTGKYRVSFITPMPTSNYSAIVTPQQSNKVNAVVPKSSMDENGFEVYIFDNSNGDFFDCAFAATVHASSTVTPTYTWTRDGTTLKPANNGDDVEVDGTILSGVSPANGAGTGVRLRSSGNLQLGRGGLTDYLIQGYQEGDASANFGVLTNGTTYIGGNIPSEPAITLNSDGKCNAVSASVGAAYTSTLPADGYLLVDKGVYIGSFAGESVLREVSSGSGSNPIYIGNQQITTSSDIRIKKDIENTTLDVIDKLKQVRVVDFAWDDPSDQCFNNKNLRGRWTGIIAQELVDVFPFAVNAPRQKESGAIDYESDNRWNVNQDQLVPILIKAFQESVTRIEALEAKVTQLEGGTN